MKELIHQLKANPAGTWKPQATPGQPEQEELTKKTDPSFTQRDPAR